MLRLNFSFQFIGHQHSQILVDHNVARVDLAHLIPTLHLRHDLTGVNHAFARGLPQPLPPPDLHLLKLFFAHLQLLRDHLKFGGIENGKLFVRQVHLRLFPH